MADFIAAFNKNGVICHSQSTTMKKSFSSFVFTGLITISLASYIYLSTTAASSPVGNMDASAQSIETAEAAEREALFPNISLIKKVLNITKMVIPRD